MAQGAQHNLPLPDTRGEGFEEKHFLRLQANSEALDALLAWQTLSQPCSQALSQPCSQALSQPCEQASSVPSAPRIEALCGAAKCGKSHLGEIWCSRNGARAVTPSLLVHGLGDVSDGAMWLDFSASEDPGKVGMTQDLERALYALYNGVMHSVGGSLLITARSEPSRWRFLLADLRSRMRAVVVRRIGDPSDGDSARLLERIFRTRQLEVDPRVYAYVHRRIERSFRAHHAIAEELDTLSLLHKRKITLPFVARYFERA